MSETRETPPRSGCSLIAGVLLVGLGALFLWNNLVSDSSMARFLSRTLVWFSIYWPVLLIAWGVFKVYRRFTAPELARVSLGEVLALMLILGAGLCLRAGRRALEEVSSKVSWNEMLGVLGSDVLGPVHEFTEIRSFPLSAKRLTIDNLRGSLVILGTDGPELGLVLTKRVHEFSESEAARIAELATVQFHDDGEQAHLEQTREEGAGFAEIDFELRMPRTAALTIRSRRGPVRLGGLSGGIDLQTSGGFIEGEDLAGGIRAETSHGSIRLERVGGSVEVRNRHGSIQISEVHGDVRAESLNGDVRIETVSGGARIENRHGVVRTSSVEGDVEIEAEHSEVSVESSGGSVDIETSYRPVYVHGTGGSLRLDTRNGPVIVRDIEGDVAIRSKYRSVTVSHVSGRVEIDGSQSAVTVEDVEGPVTIESSHEDVRVTNFDSTLDVRSTHAPLFVTTPRIGGAINLRSTYGAVELSLPKGASLRVGARSLDGELVSKDFPGLTLTRGEDQTGAFWEGSVGQGEHPLIVETSYGDIVLEAIRP